MTTVEVLRLKTDVQSALPKRRWIMYLVSHG